MLHGLGSGEAFKHGHNTEPGRSHQSVTSSRVQANKVYWAELHLVSSSRAADSSVLGNSVSLNPPPPKKARRHWFPWHCKVGHCGTMEALKIRTEIKPGSWFSPCIMYDELEATVASSLLCSNRLWLLWIHLKVQFLRNWKMALNLIGPNPLCRIQAYEMDLTQFD